MAALTSYVASIWELWFLGSSFAGWFWTIFLTHVSPLGAMLFGNCSFVGAPLSVLHHGLVRSCRKRTPLVVL